LIEVERNKDGERAMEFIPEAAHYYTTQGMGSVDRMNQTLRSHDWEHKNYSWRSCHFQTLFRFVLSNSWVIYKKMNKSIPYSQFLQSLKGEFKSKFEEVWNEKKEMKKTQQKKRKLEKQTERRNEKKMKKSLNSSLISKQF
jgi:hypothetical protein